MSFNLSNEYNDIEANSSIPSGYSIFSTGPPDSVIYDVTKSDVIFPANSISLTSESFVIRVPTICLHFSGMIIFTCFLPTSDNPCIVSLVSQSKKSSVLLSELSASLLSLFYSLVFSTFVFAFSVPHDIIVPANVAIKIKMIIFFFILTYLIL